MAVITNLLVRMRNVDFTYNFYISKTILQSLEK